MTVDIHEVLKPYKWNELVDRSSQATPFHRHESLAAIADHTDATLHPYVGFDGEEPVGIFPIFVVSKGPVSAAFSPPPNVKIPYLGPALINPEQRKQRQKEQTNYRFIDSCLEKLADANRLIFMHFFSAPHYTDIRPFTWNNFTLATKFTYFVDLRPTEEELLMSFSKDARQNIRSTDESAYDVYVGGKKDLVRTNKMIKQRHEEHRATYNVSSSFLLDLYEALPDGIMNVYVCEVADQFAGGHITLETKDMSYGWQGWGDLEIDVPVNDLIEWRMMTNARNRGAEWYDFNGANLQRLSKYKAKFNPKLRAYKRIQKGMLGMDFVSEVYKRIR